MSQILNFPLRSQVAGIFRIESESEKH